MAHRVICTACGEIEPRDSMCVMSDDGEGDHSLTMMTAATDADAEFVRRVDVHHEQGSQER